MFVHDEDNMFPGELQYPSGRSRYAALKERKARLAKSKSSATIGLGGGDDDDDDDAEEILTPFTSRFGGELARSRSSHMLKVQSYKENKTSRKFLSYMDVFLFPNVYGLT